MSITSAFAHFYLKPVSISCLLLGIDIGSSVILEFNFIFSGFIVVVIIVIGDYFYCSTSNHSSQKLTVT
jgi:hypothetical protein